MQKTDRDLYAFAEKCLTSYHKNLKELEELRALRNRVQGNYSSISSTPPVVLLHLEYMNDTVDRLNAMTDPITFMLRVMPDADREVLERKYFNGASWEEVASELRQDARYLRRRVRPRLLKNAACCIFGKIAGTSSYLAA